MRAPVSASMAPQSSRLASLTEDSVVCHADLPLSMRPSPSLNDELERSKTENEHLLNRLRELEVLLQKESEASNNAEALSSAASPEGKPHTDADKSNSHVSPANEDLEKQGRIASEQQLAKDASSCESCEAATFAIPGTELGEKVIEAPDSPLLPGLAMTPEKASSGDPRMEEHVQQAISEKDAAIQQLEEQLTKMKERMAQIEAAKPERRGGWSPAAQEARRSSLPSRPLQTTGIGERAELRPMLQAQKGQAEKEASTAKGVRNLRELYNKSKSTSSMDGEGVNHRQLTKNEVQAKLTRLVAGGCTDLNEVRRLRREVELLQAAEPDAPRSRSSTGSLE